jgi:hypothetical protein
VHIADLVDVVSAGRDAGHGFDRLLDRRAEEAERRGCAFGAGALAVENGLPGPIVHDGVRGFTAHVRIDSYLRSATKCHAAS